MASRHQQPWPLPLNAVSQIFNTLRFEVKSLKPKNGLNWPALRRVFQRGVGLHSCPSKPEKMGRGPECISTAFIPPARVPGVRRPLPPQSFAVSAHADYSRPDERQSQGHTARITSQVDRLTPRFSPARVRIGAFSGAPA
jgi:hypothetical protein